VSRSTLGPTQPPIQWVSGALSLRVEWPEREANHLPPYSAEGKECVELYLHSVVLKLSTGTSEDKSLGWEGAAGCCEHGNEPLGSIKGGKFLH
jgi:hypothetical protein